MTVEDNIKTKLSEIEDSEDVRVILAVESGSRAWGFESPDSDYDARFIYVRTTEDYLKLKPVRDVIEWQLDEVYDINGWDLQKALRLLHDSNPTIHEWCNSPIVYKESELADQLRDLAREYFIPKKALYHYISMAEYTRNAYLTSAEVKLKKYFYVLRPILAAKWVADYKTAPPMLFDELVESELDPYLTQIVRDLLEIKRQTSELGIGSRIPELDAYFEEQIEELNLCAEREENQKKDWDALDEFFNKSVLSK